MKKLLKYTVVFLLTQQTCFGYSLENLLSTNHSHETSVFTVVGALAFVIALIFLTGFIYSKLNMVSSKLVKKTRNNDLEDKILVLSSTHLNNNQSLHVVEVNGKKMLLGVTQTSVSVLKDLGETKDFHYEDVQEEDLKVEEKTPLNEIFEETIVDESKVDDEENFGLYKKYL